MHCRAAAAVLALLAGCGGDAGTPDDTPGPPPDPLPPAGTSRWAAYELDSDADGMLDAITLYAYDEAGRRAAETTYRVLDGQPASDPVVQTRWRYDGFGRVTGITVSDRAAGTETTSTLAYGPDGRLATRHDLVSPYAVSFETRFTWRDGRLVEAVRSGAGAGRYQVSYGADGFVSTLRFDGTQGWSIEYRYAWRPDGQPLQAIGDDGQILVVRDFRYDADGRRVDTLVQDDGLDVLAVRLAHDAQGRLSTLSYDDFPDSSGFVPERIGRYRWEAAACQQTRVPDLPPHAAQLDAGLIAPDNVTFGCAP